MTTYAADHETGAPLCGECAVSACVSTSYECRAEHCCCDCRGLAVYVYERGPDDAERAAALDERPSDKLAVIAAELERENRPDAAELVAERFGRPTRSRA